MAKEEPEKHFPFFQKLTSEARQAFLKAIRERTYDKGVMVFKQGEPRQVFSLITRGLLEISKDFDHESELFALLGPGEFFGEEALSNPSSPHTKSGKALEKLTVFEVAGETFQKFVEEHPKAAKTVFLTIVGNLAERLHHADNKLIALYYTGRILAERERIDLAAPRILRAILTVIRAKRALFALFHHYRQEIYLAGTVGYEGTEGLPGLTLALTGDPVLGKIAQEGEVLVVKRGEKNKDFPRASYASDSMIGVPIKIHSRVMGALLLLDKENEDFSVNNRILLEIIAREIAGAVHMAEVAQLERAKEELERVYIKPLSG